MAAVRQWLKSRHVYTQDEWLEACINFVKEDNEERQLTSVQLNELVYEQWLMADIQESSVPRLPEGLGNTDICKLEGHFNLQINSILNVGESAYSQIQKLKGQDDPVELNWKVNPSEPKVKPSRMLLLELTDGSQTVYGMEYQLIQTLKVTTPPGTKIQLSGHITCRLGALLLTANNVKVLGGSVQLLEDNSFWNVLHQAIGQEPPEKPGVVKTETISNEEWNVNHSSIQSGTAGDVVMNRNQRACIKTEAEPTNMSARGLASNNWTGNTGNFHECGGRVKQQGPTGNRAVKGVAHTNSSRVFKVESEVTNDQLFDDDDDVIAAIADEDYFGIDEDFDMEEIDQLEMGMQDRNVTSTGKTKTAKADDLEMLCDDDEIFEDDFATEDLQSEDADCIEIKPLHQRICNKDIVEMMHQSKKAKISNSSSVKYFNHSSNTSSSDTPSTKTELQVTSQRPIHLMTGPMSQINNSSFPSCSALIKTETCSKTSSSGSFKLSSAKSKSKAKYTTHSATTLSSSLEASRSLQIQKDGLPNSTFTATEAQENHPHPILDHGSHELSPLGGEVTNLECNSAPFKYLSQVWKRNPVSEECIVRVKAYIATIVSRSPPTSPNWSVIVKLNDGTDTLDADLSEKEKIRLLPENFIQLILPVRPPVVLTELLEFPVDEFRREMQEAIKTRNTALCQRVQKRTELFQRNLASTSCLMDLLFPPDKVRPRVLHLSQPTSMDVSEMLRRVSALF